MKRFISILLCALMLVSVVAGLASCNQTSDPASRPDTLRAEGYYPSIKLSLSTLSYVQYLPVLEAMGWTLTDNDIMDLIEKELGMKFELAIDVTDIGVYFEKLATNIAAGNMADINNLGDSYFGIPNLKSAESNGLLADLTAYVKGTDPDVKASEDVLEIWDALGYDMFYPGTFDGKIKTLPWCSDSRGSAYGFIYFRQDWLDEAGLAVPTTLDELTDVMRAFKNRGNGTYGLPVTSQGCISQGENYCSLFDMFGAHPMQWLEDEDGKLYLGATDGERMKAVLTVLRDWYAEGLINQNLYDVETGEGLGGLHYMSQEFINGKCGVFFGNQSMGFVTNTIKKNPDAEIVAVPLFAADGYDLELSASSNAFMFYGVSTTCKNPEAIMKLYNWYVDISKDSNYINYFSATVYENSSGEEIEDYPRVQFAPVRTGVLTNVEETRTFLEDILAGNTENMTKSQLSTYEKYVQALEDVQSDDAKVKSKAYWTTKLYCEDGVASKQCDIYENATFVTSKFFDSKTPAMETYGTDADAVIILDALQIIIGLNPVESWDTTIDNWKSVGGTDITNEVNEWWAGIKGNN